MKPSKQKDFAAYLREGFDGIAGVLFYGEDRGLSLENLGRAEARMLPNGDDGFSLFELEPEAIKANPAALADEADAMSFTAGRKVIRIKNAGADIVPAVEKWLASAEARGQAEWPAILLAASDDTQGGLRSLFENDERLLAVPSYLDGGRELPQLVREALGGAGTRSISPEVMDFIVARLGENRATTRAELEKLALYMHGRGEITLEDAASALMDTSALTRGDLGPIVAEGNLRRLSGAYPRLIAEGEAAPSLVRSVAVHFRNLYAMELDWLEQKPRGEEDLRAFARAHKIFWKAEKSYWRQLEAWRPDDIIRAISRLGDLEIECKSTGANAEMLAAQEFLYLCRRAAKK